MSDSVGMESISSTIEADPLYNAPTGMNVCTYVQYHSNVTLHLLAHIEKLLGVVSTSFANVYPARHGTDTCKCHTPLFYIPDNLCVPSVTLN